MLARLILVLALLPCLCPPAYGGAWPRARGEGFLAASGTVEAPDEFGLYRQSFSVFAEYGATDRLTLGLDLSGDAVSLSKVIGFLRWPLGQPSRKVKLAIELGVGRIAGENALRPAVSIGRGFTVADRDGWLNADIRAILFGGRSTAYESDLTAGLSFSPRLKGIIQVQAGVLEEGRDYLRFAPSFVYERRPGTYLELGLIEPLSGGGQRGFMLGLWHRF